MNIEHVSGFKYRIPKEGKMRVDATFYASEAILEDLKSEDYASLRQICNVATLPGVVEPALTMPDIHWGYGFPIGGVAAFDPVEGGVVSPGGVGFDINCGVRLLVAELGREEVDPGEGRMVEDPQKNRLADALYESVPSGVGKGRKDTDLSREDLEEILVGGAGALVERGYGEAEDLENIESEGRLPGADPGAVSDRAYQRGVSQLGTLGSGNHFLEVQYVDEVYDEEAARAYGLAVGKVTVLIHSGSRGLGHQVCQDHVERCMDAADKYGIELEDRQLAAAPIRSPEGEAYLGAMAAAANFAFANRQLITHFTREAFRRAGFEEHRLKVLYDLAHNNAKFEEHVGAGEVLVHRKGATRAFGPGNGELPERYRPVGQPVLVPGDMGRYSFVLAGTEGAMSETFGSSAHGAGRKMGRKKAKKAAKGRNLRRELEDKGILVRAASKATIDEEMSEAYKDATEVVDTTDGAGIGKKVVRLRPLIVVKGCGYGVRYGGRGFVQEQGRRRTEARREAGRVPGRGPGGPRPAAGRGTRGYEISRSLEAPLDVFVARKLGAPRRPEFGIGAVAQGGVRVLNEDAVEALGIPEEYIERAAEEETSEIERRLGLLRGEGRPEPEIRGRTAILVDDGLATGVTARAAVEALCLYGPRRLVLAVPVCATQTAKTLRSEVDELVCLEAPADLGAIGFWYEDFYQVPDEEVVGLLERARREQDEGGATGRERRA